MPTDYRLSRPLAARMLGVLIAAMGVVVLLVTLAVAFLGVDATVLTVTVLAAAAAVLGAALVLSRRTTVVRLDATGYRVRLVRGAGVDEARWTDVEDAGKRTA